MSTKRKRNLRSCCTPEVGTKVFAYFNLIFTSFSCLAFLVLMVCTMTGAADILPDALWIFSFRTNGLMAIIVLVVYLIMSVLFSMIAVVFAGFLLSGVLKKKADYLHAYYVYGVVVLCLSTLGLIGILLVEWGDDLFEFVIAAFVICVVYALILWMIKKTIILYRTLATQYEHTILDEKSKIPLNTA